MIICVECLPISVNSLYKRGRYGNTYKTKDADTFTEYLWKEVISNGRQKLEGFVEIKKAHFYFKDKKKFKSSDVDNLLKHSIDSIVYSGVIEDDRYIKKISDVEKFLSDRDYTEIIVEKSEYIIK